MLPRKNVTYIVDKYFTQDKIKAEYYSDCDRIVGVKENGIVFDLPKYSWRYNAILNEIKLENFNQDLKFILK